MAKDKEKPASGEEVPKKPKKKKLIILIAGLVVVLGGGGAVGYLMFAPKGPTKVVAPTPGVVVVLEAVTINLADAHYLKLKMSLQLTAAAGAEVIDGSRAVDLAIDEYSNRPMAELFSNDERNRSKAELLKKVEKAYEKKVMDIYFTTFVIQ
jgi:flagellar FliL protein